MTLQQLSGMITVNPGNNTQLIEVDVKNSDPQLAMNLANEVSQSFRQFSDARLPASIEILPAQLPTTPVSPKTLTNTLIGILVGLFLAVALIIIFEWLDDRPSSTEEIQELLGLEALVSLPRLSRKHYAKPIEELPALAEGCRKLCASLNVAQRTNPFKLVMVTSALAGEGKSSIASDLATFLAVSGRRVLLVDANLGNPALDVHFNLHTPEELANGLVVTWSEIEKYLNGQPTSVPNLQVLTAGVLDMRVMTAGVLANSASDLLQSPWAEQLFEHFKKSPFDYVIFDAPALLSAADTQTLASYAHTALLVVDASKTPRKVLAQVKRSLHRLHLRALGIVLNKSPWGTRSTYDTQNQYMKRTKTYSSSVLPPGSSHAVEVKESMNGSGHVDQAMTVTLPRRQNSEGKQ
jgi:capsular exopolysaccharide synthesis family protein